MPQNWHRKYFKDADYEYEYKFWKHGHWIGPNVKQSGTNDQRGKIVSNLLKIGKEPTSNIGSWNTTTNLKNLVKKVS